MIRLCGSFGLEVRDEGEDSSCAGVCVTERQPFL